MPGRKEAPRGSRGRSDKMTEQKKRLTKEQIQEMLNKTCMGRQWLVMRRVDDFNSLAGFLKANHVTQVRLGEEELTYEIVDKENTRAAAFLLTRRAGQPDGGKEGSTWFLAVMKVAADFRGNGLGRTMVEKVKKLMAARDVKKVYVELDTGTEAPDDAEGVSDAFSFWKAMGFEEDGMTRMVLAVTK